MIPNITKGRSFRPLLAYLVRQGRGHEEHTNPHVVGGDPSIVAFQTQDELGTHEALKIAEALTRTVRAYEGTGRSVFHSSLSLPPGEKELTDERWAEIAQDFMKQMGFIGQDGLVDARWVAVRHGLARQGRDHIHIVASRVREDEHGTLVNDAWDWKKAQRIALKLEKKYKLEQRESGRHGSTTRGNKQGELARAQRDGAPETDREKLERLVRASSVKAGDEAEFVRLLRGDKRLLVSARLAPGPEQVVEGYSVALKPGKGKAEWYGNGRLKYGGRKLAHDLSLGQLRLKWAAASDQTVLASAPEGERLEQDSMASAAAAEWAAANRGEAIAPAAVAPPPLDPATWERGTAELAALREHLRSIPEADDVARARLADAVAGVFYAWSDAAEPTPGPLAAIGKSVSRSAQLRSSAVGGRRTSIPATRNAARLLAAVGRGSGASASEAARLRRLATQLANLIKALHDMHAAQGHAKRAAEMVETVMTRLAPVQAGLERAATQTAPQPGLDQAPEPALRPPGAGASTRPPRQPEQPER